MAIKKADKPSLTEIIRRKAAPGEAPFQRDAIPPLFIAQPDKPVKVQMNLKVEAGIRQRAKMKALEEGRDLQDIVQELLEDWIRR